jgi:ATP-dependent Clp protease ATP-binding subunit ClpC
MFETFTEKARRVIFFARYEASVFGSREITPEHLLLGLLRENASTADQYFRSPTAPSSIRSRLEQELPRGEKLSTSVDLPLSSAGKRALIAAAEEASLFSNKRIGAEHLLLGLLREESSLAAQILQEYGLHLAETRQELKRTPHDDSVSEEYVRERNPRPQDVLDLQGRLNAIKEQLYEAIANRDFDTARMHSNEESKVRDELFDLYQKYRLLDWIYE